MLHTIAQSLNKLANHFWNWFFNLVFVCLMLLLSPVPLIVLPLYISKCENLNQSMKNTINQSTDHSANCHLSLPWSFCQLVECEILNWSINQSINHWIYQSINQLTNHSESIKWKINRFTALLWKPWLID